MLGLRIHLFFVCATRTTGPDCTGQAATQLPTQTNENGLGLLKHSNQVLDKNWVTKFHGNATRAKKFIGLYFIIFCVAMRGSTSGACTDPTLIKNNEMG